MLFNSSVFLFLFLPLVLLGFYVLRRRGARAAATSQAMAIGLARRFWIILPLIFHSPYKAVNIIEFWRRWHMTLSRFLRNYLVV